MALEQFGWNLFFAEAFAPWAVEGCRPARVVVQERRAWVVETGDGEILVRHCRSAAAPVVGDWVALRDGGSSIEAVLPRSNGLGRKQPGGAAYEQTLAANVDVAFLVMGLDGDYNLRRLERYLVLCAASRVEAVIVLNKSDLCDDWHLRLIEAERLAACRQVVVLSALTGAGFERLPATVEPGQTAALLGSSGAGKSTILNRLRGYEIQKTQTVRAGDDRGRHTTTSRRLFHLEQGWLLMDLPGLREVQPLAETSDLGSVFPEVEALASQCRFRDCRHDGEPGCAVAGSVDGDRLASYHKLVREAEYLERRLDPVAQAEQKARWKTIHKAARDFYKK